MGIVGSNVPTLSVVIPTLRRNEKHVRVLDGLEAQSLPPDQFEVVVANDALQEDPAAVAEQLRGRPYATKNPQAAIPGASAARNAGWRAADGEIVLFLDDDVVPVRGLVEEHLSWHARHPGREVGVLGLVDWAPGIKVTPFMRWVEQGIQFDFGAIQGTEAGWGRFYTANASVKRSLLELVGGFDEEGLPFGYEDLDLAKRMHEQAGFQLYLNRAALGQHLHVMTLEGWRDQVRRIARSEVAFCRKHPDVPPYFHALFTAALEAEPARGIVGRAARFIPRGTPLIGRKVWESFDWSTRQELARHFFDEWRRLDTAGLQPVATARQSAV
jgi:glycosyltransferase involved in cell wall biosynthesis